MPPMARVLWEPPTLHIPRTAATREAAARAARSCRLPASYVERKGRIRRLVLLVLLMRWNNGVSEAAKLDGRAGSRLSGEGFTQHAKPTSCQAFLSFLPIFDTFASVAGFR